MNVNKRRVHTGNLADRDVEHNPNARESFANESRANHLAFHVALPISARYAARYNSHAGAQVRAYRVSRCTMQVVIDTSAPASVASLMHEVVLIHRKANAPLKAAVMSRDEALRGVIG
jgi:hypothetical protein